MKKMNKIIITVLCIITLTTSVFGFNLLINRLEKCAEEIKHEQQLQERRIKIDKLNNNNTNLNYYYEKE